MKIKNVSGSTFTFKVGKRAYTLANNATTTVAEDTDSLEDVIREVEADKLELVGIPSLAQYGGTPAVHGYIPVTVGAATDTDTITIAGEIFELDDDDSVTAGNTSVTIEVSSTLTAQNLKTAINANAVLAALDVVADDVITIGAEDARLIIKAKGTTTIDNVAVTETGDTFTVGDDVAAAESAGYRTAFVKVTATAATVLAPTGLDEVYDTFVSVRTVAGAERAWDGATILGNGFVYLDDSGDTDIEATNVVTIIAVGK